MRKVLLVFCAAALFFSACKSKKTNKSTATSTAVASTSAPAATPVTPVPDEAMVTAGKTKFPDVTIDVLKKGEAIYNGPCTNCHKAKKITKWDEKEWTDILNEMAHKAELGPNEKDAVWKYIMSVKLAAK